MVHMMSIWHSKRRVEPSFKYPKGFDWNEDFGHRLGMKPPAEQARLMNENEVLYPALSASTFEAKQFPEYVKFVTPEKLPQDFYQPHSHFFVISQRVKDKIEELEPRLHQYFPIRLLQKDGSEPFGNYYVLNIRFSTFSIDGEKSPKYHWYRNDAGDREHIYFIPKYFPQKADCTPLPPPPSDIPDDIKFVSKASIVGTHHVWHEHLSLKTPPNNGSYLWQVTEDGTGWGVRPVDASKPKAPLYLSHLQDYYLYVSNTFYDWIIANDVKGLKRMVKGCLDTDLMAGGRYG